MSKNIPSRAFKAQSRKAPCAWCVLRSRILKSRAYIYPQPSNTVIYYLFANPFYLVDFFLFIKTILLHLWSKYACFSFFYQYYSCLPSDKFVTPCLFLRNTEDIYGWVPYHIRPSASCDTAPNHRYLSVLRKNKQGVTNLSLGRHEYYW